MTLLRLLLLIMFTIIVAYTLMVANTHGWGLISVFVDDIVAINWSGQFNLDFMGYLILSATWVAWRHCFSLSGVGLALLASVGGMTFFAPYLLLASVKAKGNIKQLLMGQQQG